MANYDFKCTSCGEVEEKEIPMAEIKEAQNNQVCSKCGSKSERIWEPWRGTNLCKGMCGVSSKSNWTN